MHSPGRFLLVASSAGFPAGRGTAPTPRTTPSSAGPARAATADSVSAHRAATGFIAAFDSLQREPFRACFADDITMFFPFPQLPSRVDGRQAVEEVFRQLMESQRTRRTRAGQPMVQGLNPRDLRVRMAGPGVAIVTFHLGGTPPAPLGGVPADGRCVEGGALACVLGRRAGRRLAPAAAGRQTRDGRRGGADSRYRPASCVRRGRNLETGASRSMKSAPTGMIRE